MNWSLRKADVGLRVTKFEPQTEKPVAGLSPYVRALWRDKRDKECRKVTPALELDDPEKYMCTCHGHERASEYCIDFCGKERE